MIAAITALLVLLVILAAEVWLLAEGLIDASSGLLRTGAGQAGGGTNDGHLAPPHGGG
jgi:hypothetical protein